MSCRKNGSVLVPTLIHDRALKKVELCDSYAVRRQTLYRGEAHRQDRVYFRVPLHRVRYLRQKVRAGLRILCVSS
jgi:hypothetical protein